MSDACLGVMTSSGTAPLLQPKPSGRLPGLDMLRGIAALCVLGLHLQAINSDIPNVFGKGYLAVDLFFMLSGYVMARTYEPRLAGGSLSPLAFFVIRYRRLWGVMAVGSVIGLPKLLLEAAGPAAFATAAAFNLLLLPVPARGVAFPLNIPAWSICFELTANLLHGLVLWRLGMRWLLLLAAATVPLALWVALTYGTFDVGAHTEDFFAGLPRVVLSYLIGIVLQRWWRDKPPLAVPPILAFAAMPLAFAAAWALGIGDWRLDVGFVLVLCPLLIAGGLRFGSAYGAGATIATALGALSFPLYAVHMPVLQGMHLLGLGSLPGGVAALAVAIVVAVAVDAFGQWRKQGKRIGG